MKTMSYPPAIGSAKISRVSRAIPYFVGIGQDPNETERVLLNMTGRWRYIERADCLGVMPPVEKKIKCLFAMAHKKRGGRARR